MFFVHLAASAIQRAIHCPRVLATNFWFVTVTLDTRLEAISGCANINMKSLWEQWTQHTVMSIKNIKKQKPKHVAAFFSSQASLSFHVCVWGPRQEKGRARCAPFKLCMCVSGSVCVSVCEHWKMANYIFLRACTRVGSYTA